MPTVLRMASSCARPTPETDWSRTESLSLRVVVVMGGSLAQAQPVRWPCAHNPHMTTGPAPGVPLAPRASSRPRIVIIGCGFGGLEAARALRRADVDITLVDR